MSAASRIGHLLEQIQSEDLMVRQSAVSELCAESRYPEKHRRDIAYYLGIAGCETAVPTLRKLTLDSDPEVRAAAFHSLGWICTGQEVETLFHGLDDSSSLVRLAALGALVLVGGIQVIAKFKADLYHEDKERRILAVKALGFIGTPEAVEPLHKAVRHPEPEIRQAALLSIAIIRPGLDMAVVKEALEDDDPDVCKAAVTAVAMAGGRNALGEIRRVLMTTETSLKCQILEAIAELRSIEPQGFLAEYLEDKDGTVRETVAKLLEKIAGGQDLSSRKAIYGTMDQVQENVDQSTTAQKEGTWKCPRTNQY